MRIVNDILDKFDISDIETNYKSGGTSSYHPRMLLKVVVYAYLCNVNTHDERNSYSKTDPDVQFYF